MNTTYKTIKTVITLNHKSANIRLTDKSEFDLILHYFSKYNTKTEPETLHQHKKEELQPPGRKFRGKAYLFKLWISEVRPASNYTREAAIIDYPQYNSTQPSQLIGLTTTHLPLYIQYYICIFNL